MALLLFEPIVEKSLKITSFHHFVFEIDLSLTYLLLTLHNKNGVVKRSNHSIEDMWSTILAKIHASTYFWVEALSIAWYINRMHLRPLIEKSPYECYDGKKPNIAYFHIFGRNCCPLKNVNENVGKLDPRLNESIFLPSGKFYCVYYKKT